MNTLPRRANIALVARCAEMLLPTLASLWPKMPERENTLVTGAIRDAISVARCDSKFPGLTNTATEITQLVGRLTLHLHGLPAEITELPDDVTSLQTEEVQTIRNIIDVAARSARAADATDFSMTSSECDDGISWAMCVARETDNSGLSGELDKMIEMLQEYCGEALVTDESPIWWTGTGWQCN
jgi:hypothetical protein